LLITSCIFSLHHESRRLVAYIFSEIKYDLIASVLIQDNRNGRHLSPNPAVPASVEAAPLSVVLTHPMECLQGLSALHPAAILDCPRNNSNIVRKI
jgi:hypothetical protein